MVSGYGVELALKRTDYIVIDDRNTETGEETEVTATLKTEDVSLDTEEVADLKPLSSSELLGLGLKASSFVMASEDPFDALLKVSQDFPKHSSPISRINASADFITEHHGNREKFLPAGYNVMWMNGLQVEERQMDVYALLEQLRRERLVVGSLKDTGLSGTEAVSLISHQSIAQSKSEGVTQRYDYRDALEGSHVIIWLNDIEKDRRYETWPENTGALLQRVFPGQLPSVRRDIHNLVMPVDLTDKKDIELVVETLQGFVQRKIPIRFGVVPVTKTPAAEKQAKVIYHLLDAYGLAAVMAYLEASMQGKTTTDFRDVKFQAAIKDRRPLNDIVASETLSEVLESNEYRSRVQNNQRYLRRLAADGSSPIFFMNGVALPRNDGWLQAMSSRIDIDLRTLQQNVYQQLIAEDAWLAGTFIEGAVTNRNALIIPEDESSVKILDIGKIIQNHQTIYQGLPRILSNKDALKQFWAHLIVVADLDTEEGAALGVAAMEFSKQQIEVEIVLLHNPSLPVTKNSRSALLFELLLKGLELDADEVLTILTRKTGSMAVSEENPVNEMVNAFWEAMLPFASSLGIAPGQQGIVLDGRFVGPIPQAEPFGVDDLNQLLSYERTKRLSPAYTALAALGLEDRMESPLAAAKVSSLIALSSISDVPEGIFESSSSLRMSAYSLWDAKHTAIETGNASNASVFIVASIDPTSEVAQRWIPILKVVSELSGVRTQIFLNPRERMQELPVKRFYRHVLQSKPSFDHDGSLHNLNATFEGLPREALLNLAMDVPPAWLVAPKESIHDLDNIKLSALKKGVDIEAVYELEHILIEGHSRDVTVGTAPRGVQLLLGTESNPHFADTLIMANLGYFQFKANPGYWNIQLKEGRSQQIFEIESAGTMGYMPQLGDETTEIALTSFQGKTLFPRLARKEGQEIEDVLDEGHKAGSPMDYVSKASKFATSVLSNIGISTKSEHADINIFSVASGHLYERMLNIMMVSVMRHTKHTVKFWFIEQFLSPSFKSFLPHLAAAYNFDYEMVTYKWPHWLRAQKEKQREIWGYKILFLDVLFPLSLDKVIFVDADQIVRTDMYELVTHDLKDAPYGFTPMCDSRTEMEGFRFWKQGYWKNFLRGLPYHISALYVVDLKNFRQIAAGDRLRQQYHQLSADPASLSNLDQDLPNHMQVVLPIHSLPQEWLWCETWCSDEALKEAKTIDLCNNPLTKEPKLERARRQVPEWTVYDDEIAELAKRVKMETAAKALRGGAHETEVPVFKQDEDQESHKMVGDGEHQGHEETKKVKDEL